MNESTVNETIVTFVLIKNEPIESIDKKLLQTTMIRSYFI